MWNFISHVRNYLIINNVTICNMSKFNDIMNTAGNVAQSGSKIVSLAGGLASLIGGRKRAMDQQRDLMDLQYEYQQRAAKAEYERQLDFWNKNNAYNTPSEWRKRMEDADLLPAAMLNDGGAIGQATLGSSSTPSVGSPNANLSTPGLDASLKFLQIAQGLANVRNTESNTKLNEQKVVTENYQQRSLDAGAKILQTRIPGIESENAMKEVEARIAAATETDRIDMSDTAAQEAWEQLRLLKQQYKNAVKDGRIKDAQFREISKNISVMDTQILLMRAQTALTEMNEQYLAARIPYIAELIHLAEQDGTIKDYFINGPGDGETSQMEAERRGAVSEATLADWQATHEGIRSFGDVLFPGLDLIVRLLGIRPDSPRGKTIAGKIMGKRLPTKK